MTEPDVPYSPLKEKNSNPSGGMYFSFFKAPINEPQKKPYKDITLKQAFELIRSDHYAARSKKLISLEPRDQKKYKQTGLDFVTYSGTFKYRAEEGLINRSQYFCVDIDDVGDNDKLNEVKARILEKLTPALMNISPRKEGLKVLLCISPGDGTHKEFYQTIENYFNQVILLGLKNTLGNDLTIDKSCKDVCRAAFLACDAGCFYSESPTIIDKTYIDTFFSYKPAVTSIKNASVPDEVDTALKMIREAPDGQKHITLLKASRLVGGIVASGQIDESEAIRLLEQEISKRNIHSFRQAQNTILNGIKNGKEDPIISKQTPKLSNELIVPPLPINGLPEPLQDLINIYADVYGTHRDFWAAAFLVATSLGIGQARKLKTKYINAPCLWFTFIAPTSVGKTEPLSVALEPYHVIDNKNYLEYKESEQEYNVWKNTPVSDRLVEHMDFPACSQYVLQDFTPESLYKVHSENLRGVIIYRDELKAWINDFNRYNKSGEQENYLSLFMGKPFIVNRKNQTLRIPQPFVNVAGGLQPSLIPEFAKDNREHNGFLARFCHVFPDDAEKPLFNQNTVPENVSNKYKEYIRNLLSIKYEPDNKEYICLSPGADMLYQNWYNTNTVKINNEKSDYLRGVYGKLDIISLRLAITIHFAKWASTALVENCITEDTMQTAIDITEYFRITGLKFYNYLQRGSGKEITNNLVAQFLHDKGNSQNEIAGVLKCSQQNVQRFLKNRNL